MSARIIDGKAVAGQIQEQLAVEVAEFRARTGETPCLAAVLVGADPASQIYVRNKRRACEQVGIDSRLFRLSQATSRNQLLELVARLNEDVMVHGILVQLPLPNAIAPEQILDAVHPHKDVDGFHPENVGLLSQGRPRFLPCTPLGVQYLLMHSGIEVSGKHVVIVGRSDIVGKPLGLMLVQRRSPFGPEFANATVTLSHSRTTNLGELCRQAEVLIAAVGVAGLITGDMIRPGAAVIDVGINRTDTGLAGDVDFDTARHVASHITPVPGGVGPMTIAMLLRNTLHAARLRDGLT
ncbi:MAG TPA: bifunctional 5,10-methylenetetrahydrofolate dehydrogenase/5,10-methenyltetrahydrofolate cyclohydrolase [Pirellulaceae bacterium]